MYTMADLKMVMARLRQKLRAGVIDEEDLLDNAASHGDIEQVAAWSVLIEETNP